MKFSAAFGLAALCSLSLACSAEDGSPSRSDSGSNDTGNDTGNMATNDGTQQNSGNDNLPGGNTDTTNDTSMTDTSMTDTSMTDTSMTDTSMTDTSASNADIEGTEPLISQTGWVDGSGNTLEIQGAFYTFSDNNDGGTSSIMPEDYADAPPNEICAHGEGAMVPDADSFAAYWGAGIGFNLSQIPMDDTAYAYDASSHSVEGFSFTITGPTIPASLRLKYVVDGDTSTNYCKTIVAGVNNVRFDDVHESCWLGATGDAPDPSKLTAIQWQVVTNDAEATPFDFCIEDFFAITQ